MTNFILDFSRFEFKYVLHRQLREEVESELGYFMQLDPFVGNSEGLCYAVRSLYFDDPAHTAFHDKIDGLKHRSKFRIRTYSTRPEKDVPLFLEEKGRYDNRVFKHRTLIAPSSLETSDDGITERLVGGELDDESVIEKFRYSWFRKQIRPVALIDYQRRPYISKYDREFRVTFDEQLRGTDTDSLFPERRARSLQLLPGYTVMEVKFGTTVPAWFHRIIQSYELRRTSLSKICEGMTTLNLATDL